ncbi:MAG: hypothetical protein CBB94_00080 [Gammaproteobacteria bacterium TMED34]|nr:MAG: hypothetical protein CBB94_00080 [Gammaproteobacteria bacterium TMED34]
MTDRFHLVTALWGRGFVERFLSTTLPTILSAKNLPALQGAALVKYSILTTDADAQDIKGSPLWAELVKNADVSFETSSEFEANHKYSRATDLYCVGLKESARLNAATIFLTPDALWSDGCLRRVRELANEGYRAVIVDGLRSVKGDIMPVINTLSQKSAAGALSIGSRDLMDLAIENIHPVEAISTWGVSQIHDVPYRLHWPVPGGGLLSSSFCGHPILLYPDREVAAFEGAIDHGLVQAALSDAAKVYYPADTSELAIVSIDELGFSSQNLKSTDNRRRILDISKWAYHHATPQNLEAFQNPVGRQTSETVDLETWRRIERQAKFHISAILSVRKLLIVMFELENRGAALAAALIAYGLHELNLVTALATTDELTILAPEDHGMKLQSVTVKSDAEKGVLRKRIRDHTLLGNIPAQDIPQLISGVEIVQANLQIDNWTLHIIKQPVAERSSP